MTRVPLALVLALIPALALGVPAHAAFPGENGRIAYVSDQSGNDDIWLMDADGSNKENLTPGSPAADITPVWSPDGRTIAFSSTRDGGDYDLFLLDPETGGVTPLTATTANESNPTWSPGGDRLAYTSDAAGTYDIWRISSNGSDATRLTSSFAHDADPSWAPSGNRIAFASDRLSTFQVYTLDGAATGPSGGESSVQRIVNNASWSTFPNWSPDGATIAFQKGVNGFDIYKIPSTGGSETAVTTTAAVDQGVAFSPDGARLIFARDEPSSPSEYDVVTTDASGGDLQALTPPGDGVSASDPDWQPAPVARVGGGDHPIFVDVNSLGHVQVGITATGKGLFSVPEKSEPNFGFHLGTYQPLLSNHDPNAQRRLYGFPVQDLLESTNFVPVGTPQVSGFGEGDLIVSRFRSPNGLVDVTQVVEYTYGSHDVSFRWDIDNGTSFGDLEYRAFFGGDLFTGAEEGTSSHGGIDPEILTARNDHFGAGVELVRAPGWSRHQAGSYSAVWDAIEDLAGDGLSNVVDPSYVDNGIAVQWDGTLSSGSESFPNQHGLTLRVLEEDALSFGENAGPVDASAPDTVSLPATARHGGAGLVSKRVCFSVTGANPRVGEAMTDAFGVANLSLPGGNAGNDNVFAWLDADNSGCTAGVGENEPTRTRLVRRAAVQQEQPPEQPPHVPTLAISLDPASATRDAGSEHSVTARVTVDGQPADRRPVRWAVTGANPKPVAQTDTAADGSARLSWLGQRSGRDTLEAYVDSNGDAVRQESEPAATATVDWQNGLPQSVEVADDIDDLSNPTPFRETNVEPVGNGEVYVKLPGSTSNARASQAPGVEKGFIPLRLAAQLPVGTIIDTDEGRAKVEAAADARGRKQQSADFYQGTFRVTQPRARTPITEMVLQGGSFRSCARAKRSAAGAQSSARGGRRVRRLWGSGKGRFRTRGRYSAATVRGTVWYVEDRCGGTFTQVRRGVVEVRDLGRRRTVTLRAPRTYFANARVTKR